MQRIVGVFVLFLGIGWLAAPYLHIYYRLFNSIDTQMPIIGLFLVVIGLSLLASTMRRSDFRNRRNRGDLLSPPPYSSSDRSTRR